VAPVRAEDDAEVPGVASSVAAYSETRPVF
jgi:hypothetical protein